LNFYKENILEVANRSKNICEGSKAFLDGGQFHALGSDLDPGLPNQCRSMRNLIHNIVLYHKMDLLSAPIHPAKSLRLNTVRIKRKQIADVKHSINANFKF
jgi:hypothetical protein